MTKSMIAALFATALLGSATVPAMADEDYSEYHPVTSMQAFNNMGEQTGVSFSLAADYAMKHRNYDQAIKLCQQAIDNDNDDIDTHMVYAKCLQKKLKTQVDKDPELFNKCVKEWLIVYKNEVGDEKGMSGRGLTLPFMTKFYEDEERSIPARQNLITLTGSVPRYNETDAKYLKRVCKPATSSVSGTLLTVGGDDSKAPRKRRKYPDDSTSTNTNTNAKRQASRDQEQL